MVDKKTNMLVLAKTVWSTATRARMVRFGDWGMLIRRARKANQVVAAGPKMTAPGGGWLDRGKEKREWRGGGEDIQPP